MVLSHLHGDHFDRIARRSLDTSLPILTTPHAARRLESWGFGGAEAMATWQSRELVKAGETLTVHSAPGEHTPGWASWLLPPVMGSVLRASRRGRRAVAEGLHHGGHAVSTVAA
ncbi:MBL fold metallo-hydrolase [Janibacter limosus]|uniref:MBL fold metallo-hydrolase n=1 Tax=Janibacter limosus TaxID=53458 RepID=UPI0035D9D905